jgi:hypothetical protein
MSSLTISPEELAWNPAQGMERYQRIRQAMSAPVKVKQPKPVPVPPEIKITESTGRVIKILLTPTEMPRKPHPLDDRCYDLPIMGPCQPEHVFFKYYQADHVEERRVKIKDCILYMSLVDGVPVDEILSKRRTAPVVLSRQKAAYLACKLTLRSLPEIGKAISGRDHTTILHARRKIQKLVDAGKWTPPTAAEVLAAIRLAELHR